MSAVKISSVNRVTLVGKVVGKVKFGKSTNKQDFCRLQLQTEKHVTVKGQPKAFLTSHDVVIYNQLIVPAFKQHLAEGYYIQVNGELGFENGKCVITVSNYGHDASFMYIPSEPSTAGENKDESATNSSLSSDKLQKNMKKAQSAGGQNKEHYEEPYRAPDTAHMSGDFDDDDIPF